MKTEDQASAAPAANQEKSKFSSEAGTKLPDIKISGEQHGHPGFVIAKVDSQSPMAAELDALLESKRTNIKPWRNNSLYGFYAIYNEQQEIYAFTVAGVGNEACLFQCVTFTDIVKANTEFNQIAQTLFNELATELLAHKVPEVSDWYISDSTNTIRYVFTCGTASANIFLGYTNPSVTEKRFQIINNNDSTYSWPPAQAQYLLAHDCRTGMDEFLYAVYRGNIKEVNTLTRESYFAPENLRAGLDISIIQDNEAMFDFLIKNGANPRSINNNIPFNIAHIAAQYNRPRFFAKAVSLGIDLNEQDKRFYNENGHFSDRDRAPAGWTPLHFAVAAGHEEAVRELLTVKPENDLLPAVSGWAARTLVIVNSVKANLSFPEFVTLWQLSEKLEKILNAPRRKNALQSLCIATHDHAQLPYHLAAQHNRTAILKILLSFPDGLVQINVFDRLAINFVKEDQYGYSADGRTALGYAVENNNDGATALLREHGADNAPLRASGYGAAHALYTIEMEGDNTFAGDEYAHPLHFMQFPRDETLAQEMIATPHAQRAVRFSKFPLLMHAVQNRDLAFAKFLLEHGAQETINIIDDHLGTALACAAAQGDQPMMQLLLQHGAQLEYKWNTYYYGHLRTPLGQAFEHDQYSAALFLIENGASLLNLHKQYNDARPFQLPITHRDPILLQQLIDALPDKRVLERKDYNEHTKERSYAGLITAALSNKFQEGVQILQQQTSIPATFENIQQFIRANRADIVFDLIKRFEIPYIGQARQEEFNNIFRFFLESTSTTSYLEAFFEKFYIKPATLKGHLAAFSTGRSFPGRLPTFLTMLKYSAPGEFENLTQAQKDNLLLQLLAHCSSDRYSSLFYLPGTEESMWIDLIKKMLANGANPNFRDGAGSNSLHFAAAYNLTSIIPVLLTAGAQPDFVDNSNQFPFDKRPDIARHFVAMNTINEWHTLRFPQDAALAKQRISEGPSINCPGFTPLMAALLRKDFAYADFLLEHGAQASINEIASMGTALAAAVRSGNTHYVQKLISLGADATHPSALETAISLGKNDIAQLLLQHGANLANSVPRLGALALKFAIEIHDNNLFDVALAIVCPPTQLDDWNKASFTLVMKSAFTSQNLHAVKKLSQLPVLLNNDTVYHLAASSIEIFDFFISEHAEIINQHFGSIYNGMCETRKNFATALHMLHYCQNQHPQLLAKHCVESLKNYSGSFFPKRLPILHALCTPALVQTLQPEEKNKLFNELMERCSRSEAFTTVFYKRQTEETQLTELVTLLLQNGANPNYRSDKYKPTPLHAACKHGLINLIKPLLDAGADINLTWHGQDEKTPLQCAKNPHICDLLKQHARQQPEPQRLTM